MTVTSIVLLAAFVVAGSAFVAQLRLRPFARVRAPVAPPRGSAAAGVLYAFTRAFSPNAKESASLHLPSYLTGIGYHLGIFAALAALLASLLQVTLPSPAAFTITVLLGLGLACGLALLGKRTLDARLRGISVPDDFLANLLVDATLASGIAAFARGTVLPVFQIVGAALLLYAPLGKLRHVLYLVAARRWTGEHFGRRGVRPAPGREATRG